MDPLADRLLVARPLEAVLVPLQEHPAVVDPFHLVLVHEVEEVVQPCSIRFTPLFVILLSLR